MQTYTPPRFANKAAVLAGLLAATTLLAGPWQVGAQSSIAAQKNQSLASSAGAATLALHTPSKVMDGTATRVNHYNPESKLRLALGVQAPHMAEEEQFIKDLVTKGSPNFHKFLTQDQWNERFAPAAADEQAVVDWAESQGLTVTKRYPNRLLVDVEGPVGAIEKAFGVTINNYQVGEEVDFSNDRDPVVPANLSGILHSVLGLSNIERPHRLGTSKKTVKGADYVPGPAVAEGGNGHGGGNQTEASANSAAAEKESQSASSPKAGDSFPLDDKNGTYAMDPDNIQSSEGYDYNALARLSNCCNVHSDTTGSPAASSIALVGYGAFNYSDVTTFFNAYTNNNNIGGCYMEWNLTWYFVDGSSPAVDGEAPLDVEYAGAMSNSCGFSDSGKVPNTAHIYEYEMADNSYATYEDAFNDIVSNDSAKVVSTSYGWEENVGFSGSVATGTMHPIFDNMVGTGYTLIAASGDNGASDGCGDATAVDYPSSDLDFIAAGGTQLTQNTSGIYQSEIGWQGEFWTSADNDGNGGACYNNHGGSTGGVSVLFTAPSWQSSLVSPFYLYKDGAEYEETGNTHRLVPDIALTANPDVLGEWYYATVPPATTGSWYDEGGTSIVAPELAGFFAQYNTYLNTIGNICGSGTDACTPAGLASPFIYDAGVVGAAHDPFYDMLSGCNDNDITTQFDLFYYCAAPGFDLVTGWGSANMLQLAWAINYNLIPAYGLPVITFSGPTTGVWYNSNQEVSWSVSTINTRSGGTTPPPGVAGFTQGWDSIPADPHSEPHSGEGNSFYSGPQYPFYTNGCLTLVGTSSCAGGVSQGCHTVNVEAWDNQGDPVTKTYGPICYDTVAPTIGISNNPVTPASGWWKSSVVVTLTATDPGGSGASGIYRTYYAINSGTCFPGSVSTCSVYTGPFTISGQQQSYIYYFTEDKAGNFSNETYEWVSIDLTAPTTTATLSGTLVSGKYYSPVSVKLNAADTGGSGVQYTYYQVNGGATTAYTGSPFTVSTVGADTVKYWSVDSAGNVGTAQTASFTIGGIPATISTPAPDSTLGTANVKFTWTAGEGASEYQLWLGTTGAGSDNLYASGWLTTTSATVSSVPATSATVYVRLFSYMGGKTQYYDYTYTEAAPTAAPAVMTSPAPGSTLGTSDVTFTWTAGTEKTKYQLWLGTTGVGSSNLYESGWVTSLSTTVTSVPASGVTVYARLFSYGTGGTQYYDYTYTEK
jgi:hypothetical protein